jgi:hypothetical protein
MLGPSPGASALTGGGMGRTGSIRAVLACAALAALPFVAAGTAADDDLIGAGLPVVDVSLRDDAVAGLPGVIPPGPVTVRATNDGSSDRSLALGRLDDGSVRVVARTAVLAPGEADLVVVRFRPGRWIAAEGGVSRAPAAAALVPAPAPGAPR